MGKLYSPLLYLVSVEKLYSWEFHHLLSENSICYFCRQKSLANIRPHISLMKFKLIPCRPFLRPSRQWLLITSSGYSCTHFHTLAVFKVSEHSLSPTAGQQWWPRIDEELFLLKLGSFSIERTLCSSTFTSYILGLFLDFSFFLSKNKNIVISLIATVQRTVFEPMYKEKTIAFLCDVLAFGSISIIFLRLFFIFNCGNIHVT